MKLFEFLEKYLPDYYQSDMIANINDIEKYFCGEMTDEEFCGKMF